MKFSWSFVEFRWGIDGGIAVLTWATERELCVLARSAFEAVGGGANERVAFVFLVCISLKLGMRRILK